MIRSIKFFHPHITLWTLLNFTLFNILYKLVVFVYFNHGKSVPGGKSGKSIWTMGNPCQMENPWNLFEKWKIRTRWKIRKIYLSHGKSVPDGKSWKIYFWPTKNNGDSILTYVFFYVTWLKLLFLYNDVTLWLPIESV